MPIDFIAKGFGKVKDSKKLMPEKRQEIFEKLTKLKKENQVDFQVCFETARRIDRLGLTKTTQNCLEEALGKLEIKPEECTILLDGGLKAPKEYKNQKTIIKGDEKERSIAFASIVAKVSRDTLMCKLSKKYPKYLFDVHKGYGTKTHRELIKKNGLSLEHRKTFCKNLLKKIN